MSYNETNIRNLQHLNSLKTKREKLEFMIGGRITVAKVTLLIDNSLIDGYVAKIRGIVINGDSESIFDTPEQAREYGKQIMQKWRNELAAIIQDDKK